MFKRKRGRDEPTGEPLDELFDDADDADNAEGAATAQEEIRSDPTTTGAATTGPWDASDAPDDGVPRIDLGGLRVPVPDGVELRVEVDQASGGVVAAVLVDGPSALQLGAFAAPKTAEIWTEVADEIVAGLREAGGGAEPVDGLFGRELAARIPMEAPGGHRTVQSARFVGVDGPRWFLRGLFQGPAATDPVQARRLEAAFRGVIVVRGGEAMAPRDPLPLAMPKDVLDAAAPDGDDGAAGGDGGPSPDSGPSLDPFERGPEITETR